MNTQPEVSLVWGEDGDIERTGRGPGFASTFRLTERGLAKVLASLGASGEDPQ